MPPPAAARHLAALPGSFNPPTAAHLALARAARRAGCDAVVLVLSTRTVAKELPTGLLLEDRLLLLAELARRPVRVAPGAAQGARWATPAALCVAAVNRGLYVDQAALLRATWPEAAPVAFVVGFDKIVQIFDPRYYADRDAALDALFARASFLVAPRDEHDARDLVALLARPENRRFADGVRFLPLPRGVRSVSATQARAALPAGLAAPVPAPVHAFVRATGAFQPPRALPSGEQVDAYALRAVLLDVLWRLSDAGRSDFGRLCRVATSDTPAGRRLRAALRAGAAADLAQALRALQRR
ncbi:MAG: hypothetical protein HY691_17250 [Chloroflexi bacterium]|nr:hypothetical protein [Chloroflexota bacterium]